MTGFEVRFFNRFIVGILFRDSLISHSLNLEIVEKMKKW
jgi:hypothetical protein